MKVSIKEEVKNKKAKSVASLELDLADFAGFRDFETKMFNLVGKQKPPPAIRFRVKATPMKDGKAQETPRTAAASAAPPPSTPAATPMKPISKLGDDDDDDVDERNPFGSAPSGYAGNALFKRMDGTLDQPGSLDATHALLEKAKNVAVIPKEDTYTGNALFKQVGSDEYKTPSRVAPSSVMQLMENSKEAKQKEESNPFAAPVVAAAVAAPVPVLSPSIGSPYGGSSAAGVLSPSSEELQLLRKQNKMLQETLEKQEEKIDQLRQKMRVGRSGPKSGSPPSPSTGRDAFVREKERALAESSAKLAEIEKQTAVQKAALAAEKDRSDQLAKSFDVEKKRGDDLAEKVSSLSVQLEAERKRAASAEAALVQKGGAEAKARQNEMDALRNQIAILTRDLEAEKKRASAKAIESEKQLEEARVSLQNALSRVEGEKKASHADLVSKSNEQASKLAAAERAAEEAKAKLASANREVVDLSNRLRDLESSLRKGNSQDDGEVKSLQMQLVAMEQDYESQLDELRAELQELRGGAGSGGEVNRSGGERASPSEIDRLRAQVAELRLENNDLKASQSPMRGLAARNPLMDPPPASPFASDEFEKLSSALGAMQLVQDCVWNARMTFDDRGVATACGLVLRCIKEDENASQAFEKLNAAIETAALNQLSVAGRMYWLNAVSNILDVLSKSPSASVKSPKETGVIVFEGSAGASTVPAQQLPTLKKQSSTVRKDLELLFVPRLLRVFSNIYKAIVEEIRATVTGPALAAGVLEPKSDAKSALGARHSTGEAEKVVAQLYSILQNAAASFLFPIIVKQLFQQVFYDIGAFLFNSLMRRTDLSASRSIAIKLELSAFDSWPENPPAMYKDVLRHVVKK